MRFLIIDGANVVGSRPDGWWRDRPGAAYRLQQQLAAARLPHAEIVLVLEGAARQGVPAGQDGHVQTIHAPASGDDAIVAAAHARLRDGEVTVVTADRQLRARVEAAGADTVGPSWLLDRLGMTEARHISVSIAAPMRAVYDFAADPLRLPAWAAGLAQSTVERVGDQWFALSPMGRVRVEFVTLNDPGVLDHIVTLPDGEQVHNAMRVLPDGAGCEVVFTVRRGPGSSVQQFEDDCNAVTADLQKLRDLMESQQ